MVYIVDWDIPKFPDTPRRRFYRHLNKLCRSIDPNWGRSTMSVLVTENENLAWAVFDLACAYGKVNIYEARVLAKSHG